MPKVETPVVFVLIVSLNRCRWEILFPLTQKRQLELVLQMKSDGDTMHKAWHREHLR